MGRRLYHWVAILSAAVILPVAAAQTGVGTSYDRPATNAPSSNMARTGGRYSGRYSRGGFVGGTYTTETAANRTRRAQDQRSGLSLATPPRRPFVIGGHQPAPLRLGPIAAPDRRELLRTGSLSQNRIRLSSGFMRSVSASTPLYGNATLELPLPSTPLFDVPPHGSEFHRFFNVVPAERASEERTTVPFESLMDAVEVETQAARRDTLQQGLHLFWEATGGLRADGEAVSENERPVLLRRAARLFMSVRDLAAEGEAAGTDADVYLPHLLLTHAYLERYRTSGLYTNAAINSLLAVARYDPEAFHRIAQARRDPEAFSDTREIAAYFGDYRDGHSETLERQARQYAAATAGGRSVGFLVLQAYCAWVLEDTARAEAALNQAEQILRERSHDSSEARDWSTLVAALKYAL